MKTNWYYVRKAVIDAAFGGRRTGLELIRLVRNKPDYHAFPIDFVSCIV
jgi:hypothetical protein